MGISEACYVPAALALISNHHRGGTRSLATGIHNTGLYVGAALGGLGGYLAVRFGWRFTFSILGIAGVIYALIAAMLLRDAPAHAGPTPSPLEPVSALAAGKALVKNGAFWLLTGVFGIMSLANWFAYGWMPTYLGQQFNLSAGTAGLSASGYMQAATFAGVIVGGIWADRWSLRRPRARQWVAAVGFAVGVPALLLTGTSHWLFLAIVGLVLFGLTRGLFDANGMPILRQIAPERFSATGYGVMNFFGCIVGGLITFASGALLDSHVPLRVVFESLAAAMALGAVGLALLKTRTKPFG
jgi:MFS family permease